MKVIPVTGLSGSGKTTFIRSLIPVLARIGPVGTVKHTGHHSMELPKDKDTTVMFGAGAVAVVGIDAEKTLITLGRTSLADALDLLASKGVAIAVVEGYKSSPLPKIVIGDIDLAGCVLRNPDPEEVLHSLDKFPDYLTPGEVLRDVEESSRAAKGPATMATASLPLSFVNQTDALPTLGRALPDIEGEMKTLPGVIGARVAIRRGSLFDRADEVLFAVAAARGEDAASALKEAFSRCREELAAGGATRTG